MSATYSRDTELRNVQPNDLYHLAVILDDDDYWKKLMETIPKDIDNQIFSTSSNSRIDYSAVSTNGRKYTNDHIRLIQTAFGRVGESRLCPQILFDEWGSSGRKHERPTLGVLLHLLLRAHLFRAADYVAETLLREPKPSRPTNGPGAEIICEIPSWIFADINEMANDSQNYPDTEWLQRNANFGNSVMDNNKDYYTKHRDPTDKHLTNDNGSVPIPPPRSQRSTKLLIKQQQRQTQLQPPNKSQLTANIFNNHNIFTINENEQQAANNDDASFIITDNLPKISLLFNTNTREKETGDGDDDSTPKLSFLIENSIRVSEASEDLCTSNSTPNILYSNNIESSIIPGLDVGYGKPSIDLPAVSALNLNGERDNTQQNHSSSDNVPSAALSFHANISSNNDNHFSVPCIIDTIGSETKPQLLQANVRDNLCTSKKDDEGGDDAEDDDDVDIDIDDDDDTGIPNLSIFNDSSLTSVTNTSGDNSFEQSINDSRPASADNAPTLNVL